MENKKVSPATQQPLTQQHLHHVHTELHQHGPHITTYPTSPQPTQAQPNGVVPQFLQNQYHANLNPRSPLLENRHELYGTGYNQDYTRRYASNENYNYPLSPQREQAREVQTDHNVNHELHNIPKGYNAEVYQDYLKRNPPRDTNQIYQNQSLYRSNNQYGSKPYLPYSNRIGPQSNTELLRRQYNEIQQMKLQQQMHYQNQAQMHQQQTFAERQLLLQQIHGIQPPPNLQNSMYSDGSYTNLDRYNSRTDFKEQYAGPDLQKDADRLTKNNEMKDVDKQIRQYQESQWQSNQQVDYRDDRYTRRQNQEKNKNQSSPSDYPSSNQKSNVGIISPMKSSDSNSPSIKSPSSESRRSSGGTQALRSPVAQRAPSAPVTMAGFLYKQGSDGLKVWRKRWFVLSEYCLFYYKSQDEEKLLGSVLLPSYKVSACTPDDKVLRKYAFKLEHANMRTYILAAPDQEAMLKWVKALTMASLMQNFSGEPSKKQDRLSAAKMEDPDEAPGPTYANAPPKPRRSNEGYSSPSPEMYDPNYDLLQKPVSHYSQGTSDNRYRDTNYQSANTENVYTRSPQSPPATQSYTKRPYETHNLSLPLINTLADKSENTQNLPAYRNNTQSPYSDRTRNQQKSLESHEQTYERESGSKNPFLQDTPTEVLSKDKDIQNRNYKSSSEQNKSCIDSKEERLNANQNQLNAYNKDLYGELNTKPSKSSGISTDRLIERRTPDAYGRSAIAAGYNPKAGDYEDVYDTYTENEYGRTYNKPLSPPLDNTHMADYSENAGGNRNQMQRIGGPSVLRKKKMQANAAQLSIPRPHSADFLEYESKNELESNMPVRTACEPVRQPQRPKSSLDINSYYDPNSDCYYSEESYAEKMRQSAQYLQQDRLGPRNIQIPLAKYASGLAEKQLQSPYLQSTNNNYETEFSPTRTNHEIPNFGTKYDEIEGLNSNWTLKEKNLLNQKDYSNRSGSVMSDSSNTNAYAKEAMRYDANLSEGFIRSASARLPSATEREEDKKVQQREESMKRLLEWKQRMLQSPLTRKSTPATISLARSLNQSRQSLRADHYKSKSFTNTSYNNYSSDDEASMTMPCSNNDTATTTNNVNQQVLSKKSFLGSNTSIGRTSRDAIPVRAVSPRVRWSEDKATRDNNYAMQQMSVSQQNLSTAFSSDEGWVTGRSPSRASQQPVRAVSPRVRCDLDDEQSDGQSHRASGGDVPTAGELLSRTHEELVLLLIQLRRRHAATNRAIDQCCGKISGIEDCLGSLKGVEREESLHRLEKLKHQLVELEQQYEKSKPLVQLVDNMVKLGSLYNRPGSTVERLERNQRLRQKILEEHAVEQSRWLENAAAGRPLETEAARARVAELWALQQELADEAVMLQGLKTDKNAIDSLLTGVRDKYVHPPEGGARDLEAELARVHAMLALNSKKLEQTVADNARLERELMQLRRALHAQRHSQPPPPAATLLEDEVSRVQHLVSALQRQRQELSRAVRQLTQQSRALQTTQPAAPSAVKRRMSSSWQETNLDTGLTIDHGNEDDDAPLVAPGHYDPAVAMTVPLYVDTHVGDAVSPLTSEDVTGGAFGNLSNVEKQEIKTVRIVKRESERRQRDRDRSLQPTSEWSANLDQFLEEELIQPTNYARSASVPRTDFSKFEEYYSKPQDPDYMRPHNEISSSMELSPKFPSTPSLSNYDFTRDISLNSSYHTSYNHSASLSSQYLNSPTESTRTLTRDPLSKTSSVSSLTRSHMELSPTFKSEAARQIITEMSDKTGSLHRRQVPKEKRRHYTAPHHLSSKTLNEMPKEDYNQDKLARSLDDADMERALRAPPDVVRSAIVPQRFAENTIDQLLAAPQKILIPERYIPEKPPELSPEEQQKRQEKVESIKKMLSTSSSDPSKSPDGEVRRQREHLLQMNQILAKQVMEMSKIVAVKALEDLPETERNGDLEDRSPEVELPIYQQRDNYFS